MFYRIWVCIIGFGLLTGIILLPIILSLCGPLDYRENKVAPSGVDKDLEKEKEGDTRKENHQYEMKRLRDDNNEFDFIEHKSE